MSRLQRWHQVAWQLGARSFRSQGGGRRRYGDREVPAAIVFAVTSGCTWAQLPPCRRPWQPGPDTARRRHPTDPLAARPGTTPAGQAPRRQGLRPPLHPHPPETTPDPSPHHPLRHRLLPAAGSAPLGDRAHQPPDWASSADSTAATNESPTTSRPSPVLPPLSSVHVKPPNPKEDIASPAAMHR